MVNEQIVSAILSLPRNKSTTNKSKIPNSKKQETRNN
jgi:hypothetical protein